MWTNLFDFEFFLVKMTVDKYMIKICYINSLLLQIHPMGLCNDRDFEDSMRYEMDYGWVVVVKLELPQLEPESCMSIYDKVIWFFIYHNGIPLQMILILIVATFEVDYH